MELALTPNSKKRRPSQWQLREHAKKKYVAKANDADNNKFVRRWDELNHEILVSIMQRLDTLSLMFTLSVCKTWLHAVLDYLFPPGDVLDMRRNQRFYRLIELHLNRQRATPYTKLLLPEGHVTSRMLLFLTKRLPSLKSITFHPGAWVFDVAPCRLARSWKGLEEVHCPGKGVEYVAYYWNHIHRLELMSSDVKLEDARTIASKLPRLTHLSLEFCHLHDNALSIILKGQKNLIYLDTSHAILCINQKPWYKEWNDEELSTDNSGITQILKCSRRTCMYCSPLYQYI